MTITKVPVSQIKPAIYNPRKDLKPGDPEYESLKRSIKEFGLVEPLVWNKRSGNLVGGHQRFKVLKEVLNPSEVDVVVVDLNHEQEQVLNVALNKISGAWDMERLREMFIALDESDYELTLTGFDLDSIGEIVGPAPTENEVNESDIPPPPEKPITRYGDLICLGRHKLMCGDVQIKNDLAKLMGDQKVQMVWTDPPYGVDYVGKTNDKLTIKNDTSASLKNLLTRTFQNIDFYMLPGSPIYVAHPAGPISLVFGEAFVSAGWSFRQGLVWVKDSFVLGHSDYHYKHEPIIFGYKPGEGRLGRGGKTWVGGNSETSVFEVPRPKASTDHPTMKPVALVEAMLLNSSRIGSCVLDPFCGSGTTLLTAEKTGRTCFAMEISPAYCDVIVKRYEEFTGNTVVRNAMEK